MRSGTIWSLFQMKREIDILTTYECHSLLSACSKAPTGIRNQALKKRWLRLPLTLAVARHLGFP